MREIWKNIYGFEGLYKVSNLGNIKSLARIKKMPTGGLHVLPEVVMKQKLNKGYLSVKLCKNGTVYTRKVHRLVCAAFKKNLLNKPFVNHKNCNKSDNRAVNLEWATEKENAAHAVKNGLHFSPACKGENNGNSKLKNSDISTIKDSTLSLNQLAKTYGVSKTAIAKIRRNESWLSV